MTSRPAMAPLVTAIIAAIIGASPAAAAVPSGWQSGGGNHGTRTGGSRNSVTVDSPTINRGIQIVDSTVQGGRSNIQAALCKKKFRRCRIVQKFIYFLH